uniref:GOLD domain-containing protein n=1 Tax=Bionectria ochroleuca TaxID=29856 RepID=A0A8H7NG72_BIOOC
MRAFLPLLSLASAVQALHFYVDPATPKCFFEDLPKGTLVVGHYTAQEWDDRSDVWQEHTGISIYISVDELFDNDHRVVSQRGSSSGRLHSQLLRQATTEFASPPTRTLVALHGCPPPKTTEESNLSLISSLARQTRFTAQTRRSLKTLHPESRT